MTRWRAIVDRIENGCAVLVPEGRPSMRILIGRELLPPGIRDGSLLSFRIELERTATAGRKEEIAALQAELADLPPSETFLSQEDGQGGS